MDLLLTVRGLASIAVVVWHAVGYAGGAVLINVPGRTAVWIFFGISGYVIAHGFMSGRYRLTRHDLRDFYINRFLRIYPLFLALSVIGWATEYIATGSSPLTLADVPAQLLALQFNQAYVLNGVFWTLGIELHFYLLAPLFAALLLALHARRRRVAIAFGIYVAMVGWIYFAIRMLGWSHDGRNILMNLPHFFIGMIGCWLAWKLEPDARRLRRSLIGACVLLAYTNWLYHTSPGRFWSAQGILLVDLMVLLLIVAHCSLEPTRHAKRPVYAAFAFLGVLSYGIYAWHGYLMKAFPATASNVAGLVVLSLCAAYLTYRLIERPALGLKRTHELGMRTDAAGALPQPEPEMSHPAAYGGEKGVGGSTCQSK